MKIVILDDGTIIPGLSWAGLENYGELKTYPATPKFLVIERLAEAEAAFISKIIIDEEVLSHCPNLKFIGVMATGYNNVDLEACRRRGIAVYNIPAYSSDAVAQHTFALILEIANNVGSHNDSVKQGVWHTSEYFCYWKSPVILLKGKSLGIIGYGNIGKRVAEIARVFGMDINIYSQDREACISSDFLSLHCPATKENMGFINKEFIAHMKDGAILINTSRGTLLNENDVAEALKSGKLAAAGLDVLSEEPPSAGNPLINLPNCFITPHMCWTSEEIRQTVIDRCISNLDNFISGNDTNRVDL